MTADQECLAAAQQHGLGEIVEQIADLRGVIAVVKRSDQFDRLLDLFEVRPDAGLNIGIQHHLSPRRGSWSFMEFH